MNETQPTPPTPDDRIMATLAHGSVILGLWGIVVSAVIWATQKDKSAYVRFQALQALVYHIAVMVVQLLVGLLAGFCGFGLTFLLAFGSMVTAALAAESGADVPLPLFLNVFPPLGFFGMMMPYLLVWVGILAYAFYGAYQTYQGQDFHYAIIGERVARYLAQSQPVEE